MKTTVFGVGVVAVVALASLARAQQRNPFEGDTAAINIGSSLFASRCADCHGPDARGSRGPDLTQRWARGASDESAFNVIRTGVPGSIMPPSVAPDSELWAIVAYLRSISVAPRVESTGDPERGRALFARECASCHQVRSDGAAPGPDLTNIGATRSREALVVAVRDPNATVAQGYRVATLVTRRGERIEGVIKSEDAFSIQMLTLAGELRAFAKRELADVERTMRSPMPEFSPARLDAAALEDLLGFLGTLRGAQAGK